MAAVSAAPAAHRSVRRRPFVVRNARPLLAWLLLLALLVVYHREAPRFGPREQRSIANSGMTLSIAGLGQTLVVLTGGIDLSVGPMVSMTNSLASRIANKESPNSSMALAAAAALLVGAACGLVNGLLVAYGRLQPIIVTLATASVWGGIALYLRPDPGGFVPLSFSDLLTGMTLNRQLPKAVVLLGALLIVWLVFRRTRLATRIYAVGSSEGAAYMSGINVARTKVLAYTFAGLASGAAGLFQTAQTATGNANAGNVYTLNSIAAVVLGGASLAGGAGTYLGTIAGAYVIALIPSVLFFFEVSTFYQQLFQGSILLAAVSLGALGIFRIRNRLERL
ncbi:MAG: ribose transport system permease protein [Thermomicrobiales bacterium]|jgi:ribose transport system permease protein|nr:ribose transport system permease protein [Thermomicrobiales bacterium]